MSSTGNNTKNQNQNINSYIYIDSNGQLQCTVPFNADTINTDVINANTENITTRTDYEVTGFVHATGDVVANSETDNYGLVSTAEGLATAEANIATNTTNIATNTTNISTNTTNISTLQDKTQNISVYDATKTTFDKRLNLRDDETQIRLVLDANGITDADTVLATTALQGIESGFIRTNTISSVSGGDIAINNDLSSLGISNNLRVDGDIEAVQNITSSGIVRAKLFRGWTVPLSGENTFEIGTEGGPLQMYVDENGVLKIATSVVFEPSDAQILANGNASFNNVNFTNLNSNVSATEVGYLDGVTSAIQTQIDSKQASNSNLTTITTSTAGDLIYASGTDTLAKLGVGTNGQVLTLSGGLPSWTDASGGSFDPTIASPSVGDFILYNTYTSAWENALVPTLAELTISTNGNIQTVGSPTFIFANVTLASNGYEAVLASDSNYSTVVHTFSAQSSNLFDTTPYVTHGNTYYFRARCITNLFSRTTQWKSISFVATDAFLPSNIWGWNHNTTSNNSTYSPITNWYDVSNTLTTSNDVYPTASGGAQANTWYSPNGQYWSMGQRASIALGKQSTMGTQAISGNPTYAFTTDDVLAVGPSAGAGSPNVSSIMFDLGSDKVCGRYTVKCFPSTAIGGWGSNPNSYMASATLDRWDAGVGQWINIATLPSSGLVSDQVITSTFSATVRYYRLRGAVSNYIVCSACNLSAS